MFPLGENMDKIEIKLSAEQYETLIKFLYYADYWAVSGFVSEFKSTNDRNKLFDLLNKIYECGDNINLPKSFSMSTMTSEVRFSDEEYIRLMRQVESDVEDIARHSLARDFAKQDLKKLLDVIGDDGIDSKLLKSELIHKRAQTYIREFENNGIKNLRFRMFYKITDDENDT
jgi:hypothetical protein